MAENLKPKNIDIKKIGIYLIIILALIRFLIYPLHASLQKKRVLLAEWNENYRIKSQVFERQRGSQGMKSVVEKSALFPHLFDKGIQSSYIQSDLLEKVTKMAENKGLTILNFEMLEPAAGKNMSEIPILVRMRGTSRAFIETLEFVEKSERVLSIRSMEISRGTDDQLFSLTLSAFRLER